MLLERSSTPEPPFLGLSYVVAAGFFVASFSAVSR